MSRINSKLIALILFSTLSLQGFSQCPVILNFNNGNNSSSCAGIGTNPIDSDFVGTTYATIPTSTKTANLTAQWPTSTEPDTTPAIAAFYYGLTRVADTAGPASSVTYSSSNSQYKYCLYGPTGVTGNSNFTILFVNPSTGVNMFSCAYNKNGSNVNSITPPSITTQPTNQVGCLGYKSSFSVVGAAGSGGTLTYQWMKNGIDISGATSSTYTIYSVTTADTGTEIYSVAVTESNGTVAVSNSVSLSLNNQAIYNGGSSAWTTSGNWSTASIPDSTVHVYVPAGITNMPNITSGTVKCKCLTIEPSASLTVNGGTIEIAGRINNYGTFDATNGTVVINGTGIAQTIPANTFSSNTVGSLTINNSNGVSLGGDLNLTGTLTPTSGVFTTNNYLTLKSTSSGGTANIATGSSTGNYITGNVTTERYIPVAPYRAWRLLAPITSGSQTIQSAWQEGATSISSDPKPTYGTIITCNSNYSTSDGFDAIMPNSSILAYDTVNQSWTSNPVTNTNVKTLASEQGYFLYIRGDRTVTPSNTINGAGSTTLRSTGTLRQGDQSAVTVPAGGYALIGNPYASAIDFNLISSSDRPNLGNKFWVWDPKLYGSYGLGTYVLFDAATATPWTPSVTGGSYSSANSAIPSGMAFFVQSSTNTGSITLREAHKTTGNSNVGFKTSTSTEQLHVLLKAMKSDSTWVNADGAFVLFNTAFSDSVDVDDAGKPTNFGENMGLLRYNQILALEARPIAFVNDTVQLDLWKTKQTQYQFTFTPTNFSSYTSALLFDRYTQDSSSIDLTQANDFSFDITADTASSSATRFFITFHKDQPSNVSALNNKTQKAVIYPNPTTGLFSISIPNATTGKYAIEVFDINGRLLLKKELSHTGGSALSTNITIPDHTAAGAYNVSILKDNVLFETDQLIIK